MNRKSRRQKNKEGKNRNKKAAEVINVPIDSVNNLMQINSAIQQLMDKAEVILVTIASVHGVSRGDYALTRDSTKLIYQPPKPAHPPKSQSDQESSEEKGQEEKAPE